MRSPFRRVALPRTIAAVLVVAATSVAPTRAQPPVKRTAHGAWENKTHYTIFNAPALAATVISFLDEAAR